MCSFLGHHQALRRFFGMKNFRVEIAIFAYFGPFARTKINNATPKPFRFPDRLFFLCWCEIAKKKKKKQNKEIFIFCY